VSGLPMKRVWHVSAPHHLTVSSLVRRSDVILNSSHG